MSVLLKDPEAVLDYTFDWNDGYLLVGETISTSSWTVFPASGSHVEVDSDSNTTTTTTVWLSGGVLHHVYAATNQITTSGNRTDERTLTIRVEDR
jgi:hypothetical protein